MSLNTYSIFYYGYDITPQNNIMNFDEGGGELSADINIGSYTFTELAVQMESALNGSGILVYTVTANRAARTYTISAAHPISGDPVNFTLLALTGSQIANSPWDIIGFSTDQTGAATYTGSAAGSAYTPQFIIQDHIATTDWQSAALATVNKTASGRVEVVKFGDERFLQASFEWITDIAQPSGGPITNNASGVADFRDFATALITKAPLEYMANTADRTTFEKVILESTPDSKDGTGFKLKELYDQGLPGYYYSGVYVFRVVS